jgi:glucuronate isomerase
MLAPDRLFDPDPAQKAAALELYALARDLPIISPHGHVDPALFSDPQGRFSEPASLLIQTDHYILRMLYSQGIPYEQLLSTEDPRRTWQLFADHFSLFNGTPSGLWLAHTLEEVFGVQEKLGPDTAQPIYTRMETALAEPAFNPRALFERFKIEVMATTDGAADGLEHHQAIRRSGWAGRIIPTFRPDDVTNLALPGWRDNINALSRRSSTTITPTSTATYS